MIELFVSSLITFFVVIDPPGCAPIYAGLSSGASPLQRRSMAIRAVGVASAILFVFALVGEKLLHGLGISLASFRIAGGIMLLMIAGPGSIATVMLLMARTNGLQASLVVLAAMVTILLLTLLALLAAGPLMRLLGTRIEAVITRLLGVLLAALAVQFVMDGLQVSLR